MNLLQITGGTSTPVHYAINYAPHTNFSGPTQIGDGTTMNINQGKMGEVLSV